MHLMDLLEPLCHYLNQKLTKVLKLSLVVVARGRYRSLLCAGHYYLDYAAAFDIGISRLRWKDELLIVICG